MNELFDDFAKAYSSRNGYHLAQTLTPVAPPNDPHKLTRIWQSTNHHSAKGDVKHFLKASTGHRGGLDRDEVEGWVEVYAAYWKATGEILAGESGTGSWTKVYEAWKELTSALIRGYNNFGFEAWSIPCLYMVGKYLRLFAINSDSERRRDAANQPMSGPMIVQDDFDADQEKQGQLRDCEQHLKRMFTLCLSDR